MNASNMQMLVAAAWQTALLFGAIALESAGRSQGTLNRGSSNMLQGVRIRVEI